ncbi:MAG: acylphosphatase [Candidatus Wallbacteria bacterium]
MSDRFVSHIIVSGRVQGVGFRYFVYHQALRYNICGFARNLSNGNVEVYAEGDKKSVEEFAVKVKTGPPHAFVLNASENHEPIIGAKFSCFEILEDE